MPKKRKKIEPASGFIFKAWLMFILTLAFAASAFAQDNRTSARKEKPGLVVFVVGLKDARLSDYMTNIIGSNLSREYTIIPRTDAIKEKMLELKEYEDAGHVDDYQMIEWGRQNNVSILCLVTVAKSDEYMFSAQLTDVKTNTLIGHAEYEIPALNSDDIRKAASALSARMQRKK